MFNHRKRQKYTFSANGKHPSETQTSPRQIVLLPGGTGESVGREILADEDLRQHEGLRVGFIDSDEDLISDLEKDQAYLLGGVPAQELVEALEDDPGSLPGAELLGPPNLLRKNLGSSDDIHTGSPYGERKWGVVALWFHVVRYFLPLVTFLMGLVRDLNRYDNDAGVASNGRQSLKDRIRIICSVIFSACGGTGSAIFLYLVDLFSYVLRHLWSIDLVEFEAHIVLPGVFLGKTEDPVALLAKTKATFTELLTRYERKFGPVRLGHLLISRARKPFTRMYLYDIINRDGMMVASRQQLAQVIKLVWQTINFGPMAVVYRGLLERVRSEYPRVFSAVGIYVLEFPKKWIIRQLGYRLAAEFIQHHFLFTRPEIETQDLAQQLLTDFLNRQPEVRELPIFRLDHRKKPMRVNVVDRFKSWPRKLIPRAVENYLLPTLADWQAEYEYLAPTEADENGRVIGQELEKFFSRRGGIDLTRHFLQLLDAHLAVKQQQLTQDIERAREQLARLQSAREGDHRGWRRRLSLSWRKDYLQRYQAIMTGQAELQRLTAQLAYLNYLQTRVGEYQQMVTGWWSSLEELYERLVVAEARFISQAQAQQSVVVESVVKPEDVDRFYTEGKETALALVEEGLTFKWLEDEQKFILEYTTPDQIGSNDRVSILSPEGIARHIRYCEQAWEGLRELSVEQILHDRGLDPLTVAAELEQNAAPWVAVSEVRQIPAEQRLMLLGTEQGEGGFWRGYAAKLGNINFVPTGDKTRIIFLSTIHGLDVFNLRQASPAWDQAYEQAIKEGRLLHVIPELDPLLNQQSAAGPLAKADTQVEAVEPDETELLTIIKEKTGSVKEVTHDTKK